MFLGPFTFEPSYEALCWIPFLHKALGDRFKDCIAISKGKTDSWYPCPVINAYDYFSPEEWTDRLIRRHIANGHTKPIDRDDPFDQEVLKRVGVKTELHPSDMDFVFTKETLPDYFNVVKPERWPGLPEKYIAVRMYGNQWLSQLPDLPKSELPIVKIEVIGRVDDHVDFLIGDVVTHAHDSLDVITRVVAHAERLVCSYGGMNWIALKCGTPSIGISDRGAQPDPQAPMLHSIIRKIGVPITRMHIGD